MDPKKIAEELMKSLFAQQNELAEEADNDEEEGEEDNRDDRLDEFESLLVGESG